MSKRVSDKHNITKGRSPDRSVGASPPHASLYFSHTTPSYKPQITSVTDYYAFGSHINERTYDPVKPLYRFGFNTQEKVFEITQDHYTAKFWEYDARLGRRWNVDPKPEAAWSWYSVLYDNPIKNIDWLGDKPLDDYKIDKKGHIKIIKKTDDKTDKLYNEDLTQNIEVEKGILNSKKTQITGEGIPYDVYKIRGDDKAKNLFEFVAKNSDVEWSQIKFGKDLSYISTAHEPHTDPSGSNLIYKLTIGKYTIKEHIHSHPTSIEGPSGFDNSNSNKDYGDKAFSKWIYQHNPKVKLKIYEVKTDKYIEYNHKGIIKNEK